jgi:hypothetical protein
LAFIESTHPGLNGAAKMGVLNREKT